MKRLCKHILTCTIICAIFVSPLNVSASTQSNSSSLVVEYNLSSKEKAEYTLKNSNGDIYYLTIEPVKSMQRINNGTHKITVTKKDRWKAGFIATISSNKFVSISSPYASAIAGSTRAVNLQRVNSTHSKLTFIYTYANTSYLDGFNAKIENGVMRYYIL